MARIKVSGTNLTKHFTFAEYGKTDRNSQADGSRHPAGTVAWRNSGSGLENRCRSIRGSALLPITKKSEGTRSPLICAAVRRIGTIPAISAKDFIRYAKKWKEICETHGVVGEAGLYTWGIHLGSSISYSKVFYHWDTRSGRQKNLPFTL